MNGRRTATQRSAARGRGVSAPGNKQWGFSYNNLGQPTSYTWPNGMTTQYTYDTGGRLTKIEHKDGATVKAGWAYFIGKDDNILRIADTRANVQQAWEYGYDSRKRLTHALRINDAGAPEFRMAYAYDAADNMTSQTKYTLTPAVADTFADGNYTANPVWTVGAGVWTAADNYLMNTATNSTIYTANTTANADIRYAYAIDNLGFIFNGADVYLRYVDGNNFLRLRWFLGVLALNQVVNGVSTDLKMVNLNDLDQPGPWWDVQAHMDGNKISVFHGSLGQGMATIMENVTTGILTTNRIQMQTIGTNSLWCFDNVRVLTRSVDATQTGAFTYNEANQMTASTLGGVNTTFTYDAWGRMNSRTAAGATLTYKWRFGDKLQGVYANGTPLVQYNYDAFGKRRIKNVNNIFTWWRWGAGWEPLAEYHDTNNNWTVEGFAQFNVMKNMMQPLAEVAVPAGQTPANGTYSYLGLDHISNSRAVFSQAKTQTAGMEFYPYGERLSTSGTLPYHQFTAKTFDADADMYYFPYRYYSSDTARWIALDPMGMIEGSNVYGYVGGKAIKSNDPLGLWDNPGYPGGEDCLAKLLVNELDCYIRFKAKGDDYGYEACKAFAKSAYNECMENVMNQHNNCELDDGAVEPCFGGELILVPVLVCIRGACSIIFEEVCSLSLPIPLPPLKPIPL